MEKPRKEKLKNPLPDYLRGELSDPAHGTRNHCIHLRQGYGGQDRDAPAGFAAHG
jgi:hypothetical protein